MKFKIFITLLFAHAVALGATTIKPKLQDEVLRFTVENSSQKTDYLISASVKKDTRLLERKSSKLKNSTKESPAGLAVRIRADLLNLAWETKYKTKRTSASACEAIATIEIAGEESVKICSDQLSQVSRSREIEKQLNQLLNSHAFITTKVTK